MSVYGNLDRRDRWIWRRDFLHNVGSAGSVFLEACMGPQRVSTFVVSALLLTPFLTWAGSAAADQYRADEFLSLDLSKAVLSPKRLGPPAEFAPVAVEARSDAPQMREEPSVDYRIGHTRVKQAHSDDA